MAMAGRTGNPPVRSRDGLGGSSSDVRALVFRRDLKALRLDRNLKRHLVVYVLCGAAFWVMGSVLYHRLDVCYYPAVVVLLGTVVTRKLARPQGCLLWGLLAQVLIFAFVNTLL